MFLGEKDRYEILFFPIEDSVIETIWSDTCLIPV